MRHSAIVVGGSLAGLFAANILCREGWQVLLLERVATGLDGRGAGIATHAELFDAMRRAGAQVDDFIGIAVRGRSAFDREGRELDHFAYPQYLTSWTLLYRRLRRALPPGVYRTGADVVDVVDHPQRPRVVLADGQVLDADLVVGADGGWSTVRRICNPQAQPRYAGYVAWRGLVAESLYDDRQVATHSDIHGFHTDDEQQLVHFAVAGEDDSVAPGRRRFSFLWYRPYAEDAELPDLLTDVDGERHPTSISPLKIAPRHVARLRDDARRLLPPDFAFTVRAAERPFVQPIYDLAVDRMAFGRVALVGDAAFVARPHVGAGVAKAGGDVMALADALAAHEDIDAALRAFEARRVPCGQAIVAHGRYLGAYLEGPRTRLGKPPLDVGVLIRECAMPLHELEQRNHQGEPA